MPEPIAPPATAPKIVRDLVAKFAEHQETYQRGDYNETQLRRDFLDPFFKALGWDVDNEQGYAEAYREVIHEDAIRVEKTVKAPDYGFRIGGTRKFFVEAKKPSVDIRSQVGPAFQLRRYAWTAKLPLSILTDFEELAVYDCRIKPDKADNAAKARVKIIRFDEYVDRWDEIAGIFSREAILKGSFDKYAESAKKKRGTAEVDVAFLEEIESWRETLAKNISLRNEVTDRELNFAVQLIIDRIIFLRMCEGREIEPYARLQSLLNGPGVYGRLVELFHRADEKYNSGLFHFTKEKGREEPDRFTTGLSIDDKILKDIVRRLYYPESPYEFAALPADILGQVYEQFLGKVIVRSGRTRVRVEDKPEVKKAGGVYYTPTYIVDYIVENTVGKLLEGRSAQAVGGLTAAWKLAKNGRPLSVLDPACGSGSFLIVAYQYLLDWYLRQYIEVDKPEQHSRGKAPRIYQNAKGNWRLTGGERKRILLSHIYGVDIDYQAAEVTKLSLLLKVLEGETEESLQRQARLFDKQRALPDLANNIKCGNSLIGPDFYDQQQLDLFDDHERELINAFDWKSEFSTILQGETPGFEAVIGNPPYIRMEAFKAVKSYLAANYSAHEERADFYAYFVERGIKALSSTGLFSMIVSNKFAVAKYGKPLRTLLAESAKIHSVTDFAGLPVFKRATVRTLVLAASHADSVHRPHPVYVPVPAISVFEEISSGRLSVMDVAKRTQVRIATDQLGQMPWQLTDAAVAGLISRLETKYDSLADKGIRPLFGAKTGCNEAFIVGKSERDRFVKTNRKNGDVIKPILFGREIRRYETRSAGRFVIYLHPDKDVEAYPAIEAHLTAYRSALEERATKQNWFELQQPATALLPMLAKPKIIYPIIAPGPRFTLDTEGFLINDKAFALPIDSRLILGLLNSRLGQFFFAAVCARLEGKGQCYYEFRAQFVERFPLPSLDPASATERKRHSRIEDLVQKIFGLHTRLSTSKISQDQSLLRREISTADRQIDQLVYGLYGLTDKEIAIVEEATRSD